MNQSFDDSGMDLDIDIDSISEPMGFAYGGEVEAMHLTPYGETNQESMDYQDAHSMPPMYAQGGDVDIGDYSIPRFRDRTASQMLQAFAGGGAVQGRNVGGVFDLGLGNPADRGMSPGQAYAIAPGNQGQKSYNESIEKMVNANIHQTPSTLTSIAQKYGVSPGDITTALGGQQTLESRFRQEPSYQTATVDGKQKDLFGPATMLTGGTGTGANFIAPTVTSRPRQLVDAMPGLSASQVHARNLVTGDTALNDAFARTGLAKDPATFYDWQQKMTSGTTTPDQLKAQFDPIAYDIRVKEAYKNIGREGMGNDLSAYHPSNMGEMYKAYFKPNATADEVADINNKYSTGYGNNWDVAAANKARTEVLIPSLQAEDYYKRNPDVASAFAAALKTNPALDYHGFARHHYVYNGPQEGRTWNDKIGVAEFTAPKAEDFKTIDPGGYNWWMSQLKEGKISGADFDKLFYGATAGYAGPYKDFYKDSMDKATELIKARGLSVNTGTQRLPGATGYGPNQYELISGINSLYQTNLSRDAEPGGLTFWLNQFGADGKISPEEAELFKQSAQAERTARRMAQGGYVGYANGGPVDLLRPAPNNLPALQLPTLRDAQGNEYLLKDGMRYYKDPYGVPDPSMQGGSDAYVDPNPGWSDKTPAERAEYYQDPQNALMAAVTQLGQKGFSFTSAGMLQNLLDPSKQPAEAAIARGQTPQQTFRDSELAKEAAVNAAFAEQMAKDQVDANQGAAVGDGNTGSYTSDNGGSFSPSDAGYGVYARGGYVKKPERAASYRMAAPLRLAIGGSVLNPSTGDSDYAKFMMKQQETGGPTQFAEPPPDYDKIVQDAYGAVQGRTGVGAEAGNIDQGGLDYWKSQLASGAIKPEDFKGAFSGATDQYMANNPEDKYTKQVQGFQTAQKTQKNIANLYQGILGRAPDAGGAAYWAERFGSEVDPEEAALFTQAAEPELVARTPAHIANLYKEVLGRAPDSGGASYWAREFGDEVNADEMNAFIQAAQPEMQNRALTSSPFYRPESVGIFGNSGGGGGGGGNKLVKAGINAGLSYVIGPTYDYANAARQLVQGDIPGAIGSVVSGVAGGVSGAVKSLGKKLRFADGGEVEDPQMMADKTTELQGYKTTQPEGTFTVRGPDVPASRSAKELAAYIQAMNPAVKTETVNLGFGTRGNMIPSSPDTLNLNFRLTPGEREITTLHELEHSMDARGGDIYGRPKFAKMGGMDNNYRAYNLMGQDWRPITETVKNMVDNRDKLEKFFGRPVDNAYFQKETYDALKKQGGTEALFSEQLASLSALEQTTGKFLTQDPEMRNLFPSTKMMAVFDALTGPRQTRMDARDLPPHTPVPSYTYEKNPAMRFIKKAITGENEYASPYRSFPIKRAEGSPETGEVTEAPEPRPNSAADTLKKLGLSVARGAPQIVTGAVDLAALPFTATGMIKPEDVVLSTEYLTKKGFLPPAQKGVANETMELISSSVNPAGAVKGSAAVALGMMKNAGGKTLSKQLELPLEQATKKAAESPTIRAYTGHTREIVGPYDVDRASRSADMGPGLYLTDDAEYASRSATKRVDRLPGSDVSPAVYPVDIEKSKILMHDKQYPREVLDKLRKFNRKIEDTPGATVSGEYIYEQIRKANIPKTMMPGVFKLMGFQGAEFLPGGVSGGKSYVVYDTADTAKGAYTKKKFKDGGEATADFIKKSSKRR